MWGGSRGRARPHIRLDAQPPNPHLGRLSISGDTPHHIIRWNVEKTAWSATGATGFPIALAPFCTPDHIALFAMYGGVSRKPPFFETDKTLLICQVLFTSHGVSLHEVERVVFACRLPEDQRRSILGQRGRCTPLLTRDAYAHVCGRIPPCDSAPSGSCSPS